MSGTTAARKLMRSLAVTSGAAYALNNAAVPLCRGQVLAFVNGMGGTPLLELFIVYNRLAQLCTERGVTIERNLIGNYITSLEMAGCSITLLRLDDEMVGLWDAPVHTPALRWAV